MPAINKSFPIIYLILLSIAGAAAIIAATPYGIGIYPDSAMYLLTARNLLQGHGWTIDGIAVTIFPPLYPALLALSGFFHSDPVDGSRWIQSVLWAWNIFWTGIITFKLTGKSLAASLFAAIAMLGAVDMIAYHSIALSDGLFLFFTLPALFALCTYLREGRNLYLFISALLFALGSLTRYVGFAWVVGGTLGILLFDRLERKLKDSLLFVGISCLPGIIWAIRNISYETMMGRGFDIHPFWGKAEAASLLHTINAWFFQWSVSDSFWMWFFPLALAALIIFWRKKQKEEELPEISSALNLFFVFVVSYILTLILSAAFIQADLFRDSTRLMMPLHAIGIIIISIAGHARLKKFTPTISRIVTGRVLFYGFIFFIAVTGAHYVLHLSADGQGYASSRYHESVLMKKIAAVPHDITIYSNLDLPVALYTGKMLMSIPEKIDNTTQRANKQYDTLMKSMACDIRDSSALLVYFSRRSDALVYPTLEEIQAYVPLHCIDDEADGGMYEAIPDTSKEE